MVSTSSKCALRSERIALASAAASSRRSFRSRCSLIRSAASDMSMSDVSMAFQMARAKLFCPYKGWRWYVTEWDAETGECFGLVEGFETEWGYFDLTELAEATVLGGVPAIERDLYWESKTIGEIKSESRGRVAA